MNEPFLYDIVDTMSKTVIDNMPEFVKDHEIASNMAAGFVGSTALTLGISYLLSKAMNPKLLKSFAIAEKFVGKALPYAALGYAIIDPDGAKQLMQAHPVYTAGMVSATLGTSLALGMESKRISASLEDIASKS